MKFRSWHDEMASFIVSSNYLTVIHLEIIPHAIFTMGTLGKHSGVHRVCMLWILHYESPWETLRT